MFVLTGLGCGLGLFQHGDRVNVDGVTRNLAGHLYVMAFMAFGDILVINLVNLLAFVADEHRRYARFDALLGAIDVAGLRTFRGSAFFVSDPTADFF